MVMIKTLFSIVFALTLSMFTMAAVKAENCEVIRFKLGANNHTENFARRSQFQIRLMI